jgi:hypothetical protein
MFIFNQRFPVSRPIGGRALSEWDPFLMIDEFGPINYKPGEAKGAYVI